MSYGAVLTTNKGDIMNIALWDDDTIANAKDEAEWAFFQAILQYDPAYRDHARTEESLFPNPSDAENAPPFPEANVRLYRTQAQAYAHAVVDSMLNPGDRDLTAAVTAAKAALLQAVEPIAGMKDALTDEVLGEKHSVITWVLAAEDRRLERESASAARRRR